MSIQLTERAADELRRIIAEQNLETGELRLRVGTRGTAHQRQYTLDLDETTHADDKVFESRGVSVVCLEKDLSVLDETTIDFRNEGAAGAGFTFSVPEKQHVVHSEGDHSRPPPTQDEIRQALYLVDDPEVGVNIIDLGLVYDLTVEDRDVRIRMTLTTPACPLEEHIRGEVNQRIKQRCPGVDSIGVQIVWQPKWSSDMMTPEGKKQLGWSR